MIGEKEVMLDGMEITSMTCFHVTHGTVDENKK